MGGSRMNGVRMVPIAWLAVGLLGLAAGSASAGVYTATAESGGRSNGSAFFGTDGFGQNTTGSTTAFSGTSSDDGRQVGIGRMTARKGVVNGFAAAEASIRRVAEPGPEYWGSAVAGGTARVTERLRLSSSDLDYQFTSSSLRFEASVAGGGSVSGNANGQGTFPNFIASYSFQLFIDNALVVSTFRSASAFGEEGDPGQANYTAGYDIPVTPGAVMSNAQLFVDMELLLSVTAAAIAEDNNGTGSASANTSAGGGAPLRGMSGGFEWTGVRVFDGDRLVPGLTVTDEDGVSWLNAVPAPGTLAALGLGALVVRRRR